MEFSTLYVPLTVIVIQSLFVDGLENVPLFPDMGTHLSSTKKKAKWF